MQLEDYLYNLPDLKIAQFPLKDRSSSKLLFYNKGVIRHNKFSSLPTLLPENTLLVFNNTRVIPARIFFKRSSGAIVEVFLLEPLKPSSQRELAMKETSPVQWQCMVRNLKKWKDDEALILKINSQVSLTAKIRNREEQIVELSWTPEDLHFSEIVELAGKIPLPPYMHRGATKDDISDYQTVYAVKKGAVAAPTAGLHFTGEILDELRKRQVKMEQLTLHVSAGTFQPIKSNDIQSHKMHDEEIIITRENVENLMAHEGPLIPVGTTSMRTLESLYWFGVKLIHSSDKEFFVEKLSPYKEYGWLPDKNKALRAVLEHLKGLNTDRLIGKTEIFIFPGYKFKMCDGLITNFHLPGSTLILLVAAMIGDDWRKIYEDALNNDYRFLSYGDSSLLLP